MPDTAPLRAALADALPERPFTVSLWDGTEVPTTGTDGPTFTARSPRALAHLLRAPGELGLGRAYVTGALDVDDLALTAAGADVLAGRADRVALIGFDRWLGGLHLRAGNGLWRWDGERGALVVS